jgi:hypothetical protein
MADRVRAAARRSRNCDRVTPSRCSGSRPSTRRRRRPAARSTATASIVANPGINKTPAAAVAHDILRVRRAPRTAISPNIATNIAAHPYVPKALGPPKFHGVRRSSRFAVGITTSDRAEVVTVTVAVAAPFPLSVTVDGVIAQLAPVGVPPHVKLTFPLKPTLPATDSE